MNRTQQYPAWGVGGIVLAALLCLPGHDLSGEKAPAPAGYRYQEDLGPRVGLLRGTIVVVGKLDKNGKLVEDWRHSPVQLLNKPLRENEEVYEYRVGRLIKGKLDNDGNFIPEPGSKVIALSDYQPGDRAPRIYNLPGKLARDKK